jgi:hypothetical protein
VDWMNLAQDMDQSAVSCEDSYETSVSINGGEFKD